MKKLFVAVATAFVASIFTIAHAAPVVLVFEDNAQSSNSPATGASGTVTMSFSDVAGGVLVTIAVDNTTNLTTFGAGASISKLTGFGFDLIDGATYRANSFVADVDGDMNSYLVTEIVNASASPFGTLDIAVADNGNFNGGNANGALPQGLSDTVSIILDTVSDDANALMMAYAAGFFDASPNDRIAAVLRFQQVNAGSGSDKLLFVPPTDIEIPLPAAVWLFGAGLAGLGFASRQKKAA